MRDMHRNKKRAKEINTHSKVKQDWIQDCCKDWSLNQVDLNSFIYMISMITIVIFKEKHGIFICKSE